MNIKIFLLKSERNSYAARLAPELKCIFSEHLPAQDGLQEFGSVKEAAPAIAQAFRDAHAILLFVEPAKYAETKKSLAASIGLPLHCDRALFERATETGRALVNETSDFAVAHAYLPENARPIVCADALYAGFAVTSGNQTVLFLPLERGRTEVLLGNSVIPMLNSSYRLRLTMESLRRYNADRLSAVCRSNDIRIAVAGTNTADYFKNYITAAEGLSDRVVFAEKAEKRGSLAPADYVVNLSITAAEFFGTPYGVAISNAFYAGNDPSAEKVIYLAITNEHETALREVRSVAGEDIPSLLARCCGDLCTFLSDIAGTDTKKRLAAEENRKSLVSHYRRTICIVALLIVAIGAFCGLYFKMHGYTLQTWAANAWSVVFPGSKPLFTTEPPTEEPTEATTAADAVTAATAAATTATTRPVTTTQPATTQSSGTSSGSSSRSSSSGSSSGSSGGSSSGSSGSGSSSQTAEPSSDEDENEGASRASDEPSGDEADGNDTENSAGEGDEAEDGTWEVAG